MKNISKLHYITTDPHHAEQACKGGVSWVQLRLKNVPYDTYYSVARQVQQVCKKYNATFIINDNVHLALDIKADGVHIGKDDMPPAEARQLLGDNFIIGCTANTLEDIIRLASQPIDYIGLGPYRFTTTKEKLSPVLGLEGYRSIRQQLQQARITCPPIIAIGGILSYDIPLLFNAGANGIAVSGAIHNAGDIAATAKEFMDTIAKPDATPPPTFGLGDALMTTDVIGTYSEYNYWRKINNQL